MAIWLISILLASVVSPNSDCMLVEFSADWCRPCQQMRPAMDRLTSEGWVIRHVDVDRERDLADRFQVRSLPTVVILCQGKEVDRLMGAATYEQVVSRLERWRQVKLPDQQGSTQPFTPPSIAGIRSNPTQTTNQLAGHNASSPTIRGQSPVGLTPFPMLNLPADSAKMASASPQAPLGMGGVSNLGRQFGKDTFGSEQSGLNLIDRAQAATVRIRIEDARSQSFGTGTIIDTHGDEVLVLTCGHMFRDMHPGSTLTVELFEQGKGIMFPAQVIDFEAPDNTQTSTPKPDIGLISFRTTINVQPARVLPSNESPRPGENIFSFGCDRGADPSRRDGRVTHINRYLGPANIEISGAPVVGRSGGGLFNAQGKLIGVCNAADNHDDEGIYAGPAVIYAQLNKLGLNRLFDGTSPTSQQPQLALASNIESAPLPNLSLGGRPVVRTQNPSSDEQAAWPDQRSRSNEFLDVPGSFTSQSTLATRPDESTHQLTCIVRDGRGQERVLTIASPSRELLESLEKHAAATEVARGPAAVSLR